MDLKVPGALPTMMCRAPTINGSPNAAKNMAAVKAMPGVTDVALIKEKGDKITDADLDELRNICRCGTYFRIREAIKSAAAKM